MADDARDRTAPQFDGLRLAVQFRLNQGKGEVLAVVTGVPLSVLEHFADTGEIGEGDRRTLEVYL